MAENGNRGPNDFRARDGRKRREPPIIDASATVVPVSPVEVAAASPTSPPDANDEAPVPPAAPTPDPVPSHETREPVLFGSPQRETGPNVEAAADAMPPTSDPPPSTDAHEVVAAAPDEASLALPEAATVADPAGSPGQRAEIVPPSATPAGRAGGGIAPWLLTLSSLVLLGALAWVLYTEPQRSGRAAVAGQLDDLRGKVAALEARPDPTQAQTGVAALDKRLAAADAARTDLAKTVAGLGTRLDAVAQQARGAQADADKAASAAGAARSAAQAEGDKPVATTPTGAAAAATVGALGALAARVEGLATQMSSVSDDETRTAKAVSDLPKPMAPDFGPVDAKLTALGAQVAALGGKADDAGKRLDGFGGKVDGLDARFNALEGKVNGSDARLNGFDAKVNAVDGKINGFDNRMNGLESRTNGLESKLDQRVGGLETKADGTAGSLDKLQSAVANLPKVDLSPLQSATSSLDKRIDKIEGQLSSQKDGARVTDARAVGSADDTKATPIALVGQAVERAIADGRPYAADLDALKALGAEPDAVTRLSPLAAAGAPTVSILKDRWDAVKGDVLAAVRPGEAGGAFDRFAAGARALVQVHRVGAVEGQDGAALVSQVGAALDGDDVEGALAAWTKLPQAGKDRSKDWAAAARARLDASQAAHALVGRAIATLGKSKS